MKRAILVAACAVLAAPLARADALSESWGLKGKALTHPGTFTLEERGEVKHLVVDLSAIPKGAKVYHASLLYAPRRQPREPIRLEAAGRRLALEPPWARSFDATAAVQAWVNDPKKSTGFALVRFPDFDPRRARLDVRFEGTPKDVPPQVTGLRAVHRSGQTVLVFDELPLFRPAKDEIIYVKKWRKAETEVSKTPGKDEVGNPTQPAVYLKTLRRLQGLKVRTKPGKGQRMPEFERVRELPEVRYRIYRHTRPITPKTIGQAKLVGAARPLCGYDHKMVIIFSSGEYYQKHERPDNVIPTLCFDDLTAVAPGRAFYVHTPGKAGKAYYAVTTARNGTENMAVTNANSLERPVAETAKTPTPIRYFTTRSNVRARHDQSTEHWFLFWEAPPFANLPRNTPRRIVAAVPDDFKEPGPLLIDMRGSIGREGHQADTPGALSLRMEVSGTLAYNEGKDTLRSYRACKVETFPELYVFHLVDWARGRWKIDPARISGTKGMSLHLAIRHPEVFKVFWPDRPEFYQNDFDSKWNPHGWNLDRVIGPPDLVKTADGSPGWDLYDMAWYLSRDPGKDIPFMGCLFSQPKDGNHGAEYGWQDDPKGWAALRDYRQPYVAQWGRGGGGVDRGVRRGLYRLRWDKSVPAFSRCSLDQSPGNGDPDDGDPWGQINGYLFWDYETIVDEKDRWEMTVYLVPGSPESTCTVDVTPRHRNAFHPKVGETFRWTNTSVGDGKVLASGTVTADRWGLVTLRQATVTKGKNRLVIRRP
jgi:hypothetical protein